MLSIKWWALAWRDLLQANRILIQPIFVASLRRRMERHAGEDCDDTRPRHDLAVALYFTFRVSVKIILHAWRDLSNTFLHYFRAIRAITIQVAAASGNSLGKFASLQRRSGGGNLGQLGQSFSALLGLLGVMQYCSTKLIYY